MQTKITKHFFSILITLTIFVCPVKAQFRNDAQSKWNLGIGLESGVVVGDRHEDYPFALGGSLRLQYNLTGRTSLMLTTGYTHFFGGHYNIEPSPYYNFSGKLSAPDVHIIPLKAGIKVFVASHLYLSGEAGAGFETKDFGDPSLILSPGIGYVFPGSGWDLAIRYDNYSHSGNSLSLINARIAYGFKL